MIMPAHDVARFIGVAVDSVRAQDFADWELLVVDDGSRDGTGAVVAARRDPRIRLIRQANAGVSAARSRAMEEARGEAILFLDADDWLAPDALDRLVLALAAAPEAVGAHGGYAVMEEAAAPGDAPLRLRPGRCRRANFSRCCWCRTSSPMAAMCSCGMRRCDGPALPTAPPLRRGLGILDPPGTAGSLCGGRGPGAGALRAAAPRRRLPPHGARPGGLRPSDGGDLRE
ncbi:glycosyltransferase family 2 protein [Siccirubricoccus deserti]